MSENTESQTTDRACTPDPNTSEQKPAEQTTPPVRQEAAADWDSRV